MIPCKHLTFAAILCALALSLTLARTAKAEPFFPGEIQKHLGLSYTPPCTFCHATANGGGAVTTKFGASMQKYGLGVSILSLDTALDALNSNHVDSDGDGTVDIQQIEEGRDPSTGTVSGPTERYGCGARIAPTPVRFIDIALCGAIVFAMVALRRQRQFAWGGSPKERMNKS